MKTRKIEFIFGEGYREKLQGKEERKKKAERLTDRCKNITFPQLRLRTVITGDQCWNVASCFMKVLGPRRINHIRSNMKVLLVEIQYNALSYMAGAALSRGGNIEHLMLLKRCQAVVSESFMLGGRTESDAVSTAQSEHSSL